MTCSSRIDGLVAENETALHLSLRNIETVTTTLAENSQRLDKVMAGLQNLTGGADGNGQIGQAADSIRRLADDLDKRTDEISTGLAQFSNSGLKQFEAFAVDGRRTLAELQQGDQEHRPAPDAADFWALSAACRVGAACAVNATRRARSFEGRAHAETQVHTILRPPYRDSRRDFRVLIDRVDVRHGKRLRCAVRLGPGDDLEPPVRVLGDAPCSFRPNRRN